MLRKRPRLEQFELLSILISSYSVLMNANIYYEKYATQETTRGVCPQVNQVTYVIPPKML